jgi:hypothetical protein
MKRVLSVIIPAIAIASICGCKAEADPDCPAATPVSTAQEALAFLPAEWQEGCWLWDGKHLAGAAFEVTEPIELSAADVILPEGVTCGDDGAACQVAFRLNLFGSYRNRVEILEVSNLATPGLAARIRLAPGQYRWSTQRMAPLSGEETQFAEAVLLPGCDEPCQANMDRCPDDLACYYSGAEFYANEYCMNCLGLGADNCACTTVDGMVADDTECAIEEDCSDVYVEGRCQGGVCTVQ